MTSSIGNRIKQRRKELGLSVDEVGHGVQNPNHLYPFFIFVNGLFGCIFRRI